MTKSSPQIGLENSVKKTKRSRGHSVLVKQIGGELETIEENCGTLKLCDKLVQACEKNTVTNTVVNF